MKLASAASRVYRLRTDPSWMEWVGIDRDSVWTPEIVETRVEGRSRPVTDHQMEFFDEGLDFFEIFATTLIRFQIQGAAQSDHVAEIANFGGLQVRVFDLFEHSIPELGQVGLDAGRIDLDGFAKRFADEIELLGERLHG
jgi:hypothetical protein